MMPLCLLNYDQNWSVESNITINIPNCTHFIYDWADFQAYSSSLGLTYHLIIPLLISFGIIGNVINWWTFRGSAMKSTASKYFCSQSKANMLALCSWIPLEFGYFGISFSCPELKQLQLQFMFLLYDVFSGISNTFLLFISFERYFKICQPMRKTLFYSKYTSAILVSVWIFVFAIAMPKGLSLFNVLNFHRFYYVIYSIICNSILRIFPAFFGSVLVTYTILRFRKVSTHLRLIPDNVKFEKQLTSLLLASIAFYSITILPATVAMFYAQFLTQFDYTAIVLTTIPYVIEIGYYSLNFYINIIFSDLFRQSCCCCLGFDGRQSHKSSSTSLTDF